MRPEDWFVVESPQGSEQKLQEGNNGKYILTKDNPQPTHMARYQHGTAHTWSEAEARHEEELSESYDK